MNTQQSYDQWAEQYDSNLNKTRDLEAVSLRQTLAGFKFKRALEIGCGTGKNTEWLQMVSDQLLAVDLSEEMLSIAKAKVSSKNVVFKQADITKPWDFADGLFDLVTFSLVLEHIEDLNPIYENAYRILQPGGRMYIGELHPYKQYTETKARFETDQGTQVVTCFTHHLSDFTMGAKSAGFQTELVNEYFDENVKSGTPRILTLLFNKSV